MGTRLTLRRKWTLVLLVVGAGPLALFGFTTIGIQRNGLETSERQLEVSVIDHVGSVVDRVLDDASEGTHRVGRMLTESHVTDEEARLELAREAMARAEVLAQVAIYSADGKLIDAINRAPAGGAVAKAPAPLERVTGDAREGAWLDVEYAASARPIVRYQEPVIRDGSRRAWVVGTLDEGALADRLQAISRDRFENRDDGVVLLDSGMRVLAGAANGDVATGNALEGKDVLQGQRLPRDAFSRPIALATEFTDAKGEDMVGAMRSLPSRRWAVAVRRSRAAAFGALKSAQELLGASAAAFVIAALVLGAWLAARTTRPVRELVELTRAYAKRAFDRRSTVKTGDELEELGASLSEMAGNLAASELEIARRAGVESNLSRYMPSEVAKAIAEGRQALALGGERRALTVLFADVVSFTTFAEGAAPERTVALLNELFSVLTEVVFRHGGIVDKFMGDCVMAMFGAPDAMTDHAARALAAAEDMHRFVEASAPAWRVTYGIDVKLGIGVNTGNVLLGNLGSESRMEYTAIGDVVNIASRLEGLARPGQTLMTAAVVEAAGDGFITGPLGEHPLRGKREPVQVFELQ